MTIALKYLHSNHILPNNSNKIIYFAFSALIATQKGGEMLHLLWRQDKSQYLVDFYQ